MQELWLYWLFRFLGPASWSCARFSKLRASCQLRITGKTIIVRCINVIFILLGNNFFSFTVFLNSIVSQSNRRPESKKARQSFASVETWDYLILLRYLLLKSTCPYSEGFQDTLLISSIKLINDMILYL